MDGSFLREVEETVNSLSLKWCNKYHGMVITVNRLPNKFEEFQWNHWDERDYNLYGDSLKFSFELSGYVEDEDISYFTHVMVFPENGKYVFNIHFGEQENGIIDGYAFIIEDENDYILFLQELVGYVRHTYIIAEKSLMKIG